MVCGGDGWGLGRDSERAQEGEKKKDNKRWVWQGGGYKKHSKKEHFDSLFRTELIFPVGFKFKNSCQMIKIVQQCETSSAKAFRLFFDEQQVEDGEKESDETEGWTRRLVSSAATPPQSTVQEGGGIKNHFNESRAQRERRGETFWPHSKGRKSIFPQLCYCLQEYKCDDQKRSSLEAQTGTSSNVHQTDVLKLTGSYKKGVKGEQRCYETSVTAQFIPLQTVCIVKISSSKKKLKSCTSLVRQMDASIWLPLWWWRYLFRNVSSCVLASNAKGKNELPQLQNDRRHQLQVVPHLSSLWTSDLVKILQ